MKRILFFATAVICSLSLSAASYGIMINGTDYHAGTKNDSPLDPSFQEYAVLSVTVASGSTLQLWDQDNNAGWAVDLDQASVAGITRDGDHYNCTTDGCYDFYIKLKMNADQLYIGNGNCNGGGGGGGGTASYGIMINGTEYHEGVLNPSPLDPSFQEYAVTGVSVANGATLQLWDKNNTAGWAVDLDQASVAGITRDGDHYNCTAEGCYDFYIKLKMNQDQLYIGSCSGGGTPGGGGGTGEHTVDGLYLIGEWNGQVFGDGDDYANFIEENAFVDCKISKTFVDTDPARSACWIRAKAKLDGGTGWMFFSTDGWQGDGNQTITLYSADYLFKIGHDGESNRWSVPTNQKLNITLKVISVNEIQLSLVSDAAFASWTCTDAGIGDLTEIEKVEVELDLNAPMYDVLGRKVNADYHGIVIQNGKKFIR